MIIHLKKEVLADKATELAAELQAFHIRKIDHSVLVTQSKHKELNGMSDVVEKSFVFDNDMQLSSRNYLSGKRTINVGDIQIGGETNNTLVITGPCSVESEEQVEQVALFCKEQGISVMRAGCYKPRTSPYTFQGLGLEGLKLLDKMRSKYGLKIITEVKDATHVEEVIAYADIVQIGAKSMYDHGILSRCGKAGKPVLIKRGFGTNLQEFVQAAEFVLSGGNDEVILCERGIRTFETKTRFTLDLCGVAYLKEHTNLPVLVDPSHAMGYAYGVPDLARAATAMGIDGLLIETHPNPKVAKSDASQQLTFPQFEALYKDVKSITNCIGRNVV